MKYLYGEIPTEQFEEIKGQLRKNIFFLLLCVDPTTKNDFEDVDMEGAFDNLLLKMAGYNDLFSNPPSLITAMAFLIEAKKLLGCENFEYHKYRKLILDAGAEVLNM